MHGKLPPSGVEMAAEKVERNRGRGRGSGPGHPPKTIGLSKSILLGRLARREESNEDDNIIGDLEYCKSRGGFAKTRNGLTFKLRAPTQIRNFGQLLSVTLSLLISPVLFRLRTKDLA